MKIALSIVALAVSLAPWSWAEEDELGFAYQQALEAAKKTGARVDELNRVHEEARKAQPAQAAEGPALKAFDYEDAEQRFEGKDAKSPQEGLEGVWTYLKDPDGELDAGGAVTLKFSRVETGIQAAAQGLKGLGPDGAAAAASSAKRDLPFSLSGESAAGEISSARYRFLCRSVADLLLCRVEYEWKFRDWVGEAQKKAYMAFAKGDRAELEKRITAVGHPAELAKAEIQVLRKPWDEKIAQAEAARKAEEEKARAAEAARKAEEEKARLAAEAARKAAAERASAERVLEILPRMSQSDERDRELLAVPDEVYARMEGKELVSLLGLMRRYSNYENVPKAVWSRLGVEEAKALMARWDGFASDSDWRSHAKSGILRGWLGAHQDLAGISGDGLVELVRKLEASPMRDQAILAVPGSAYGTKLHGGKTGALLGLVNNEAVYDQIPDAAWKQMGTDALLKLLKRWDAFASDSDRQRGAKERILGRWLAVGGSWARGKDLIELVETLGKSPERDRVLQRIPAAAYSKLSGEETADLLGLMLGPDSYDDVPAEAWRRLGEDGEKRLLGRWEDLFPDNDVQKRAKDKILKKLIGGGSGKDPGSAPAPPSPRPRREWGWRSHGR